MAFFVQAQAISKSKSISDKAFNLSSFYSISACFESFFYFAPRLVRGDFRIGFSLNPFRQVVYTD